MSGKYEYVIYRILKDEPVTPNEIAKKLKISHKTAKCALMRLALIRNDVRYENSGRIHIFWKVSR